MAGTDNDFEEVLAAVQDRIGQDVLVSVGMGSRFTPAIMAGVLLSGVEAPAGVCDIDGTVQFLVAEQGFSSGMPGGSFAVSPGAKASVSTKGALHLRGPGELVVSIQAKPEQTPAGRRRRSDPREELLAALHYYGGFAFRDELVRSVAYTSCAGLESTGAAMTALEESAEVELVRSIAPMRCVEGNPIVRLVGEDLEWIRRGDHDLETWR